MVRPEPHDMLAGICAALCNGSSATILRTGMGEEQMYEQMRMAAAANGGAGPAAPPTEDKFLSYAEMAFQEDETAAGGEGAEGEVIRTNDSLGTRAALLRWNDLRNVSADRARRDRRARRRRRRSSKLRWRRRRCCTPRGTEPRRRRRRSVTRRGSSAKRQSARVE